METIGFSLLSALTNFILVLTAGLASLPIIGLWFVFTKSGKPGYYSIIPIVNIISIIDIAGKPSSWFWLMLVPIYNIYIYWKICEGIALNFKKESGYALGIFLFLPIFLPILGFGNSKYSKNITS